MNIRGLSKIVLCICIGVMLSSFVSRSAKGKPRFTLLNTNVLQRNQDDSILGVYTCQDSDAVMQFESNRRFGISQNDREVTGTYRIQGEAVIINLMSLSFRLRFDGNTITDADGRQWARTQAGRPPSSKPRGQIVKSKFFAFELQQCRKSGSTIICDFVITNQDKDRGLVFGDYNSSLFDDMGNAGKINNVILANQKGAYSATSLIVSGVATKASVGFEDISPQATRISRMTIRCFTGERNAYQDMFEIQFRNIPLR